MELDYWDVLLGEELPAEEEKAYRHIWVLAETAAGELAPISLEVLRSSATALGAARGLADELGAYVQAILAGHGVKGLADQLIRYGADTVFVLDHPALSPYRTEAWLQAVGGLMEERRPEIVLLGETDLGQDLGPRLAQRLGTGLITDCLEVSLDVSQRLLLGTIAVQEGRLRATLTCPERRPQMATLRRGAARPAIPDDRRTGKVEMVTPSVDEGGVRTRVIGPAEVSRPPVSLERARIVVAGGRALGGAAIVPLLEELAAELGGVVAGDRAAVNAGWLPPEKLVSGIGGAFVAPELYLAVGVDGEAEHRLAVEGARRVVAIHPDPAAPILRWADVGIVAEPKEMLPALLNAL